MSLFVAIRPDEAAVEHLLSAIEPVRRLPLAQALRWQPASQWHITLAFLGDADEDVTDEVTERLAALDVRAIPGVRLSGADCFGRQILWIGIGDDEARARLAAAAAAIPPRLRGLGLDVDRRAWRGHLTVARARSGDARSAATALADYRGPSWDADELLVIRSTGGPRPAHRVVSAIALTPIPGAP
jgi:RNA 2',3'-cyclic 3'-phosphodiesterase